MRKHSALLEAGQGMLRVQGLSLSPEHESQYRDAWEPVTGEVLAYSDSPVDKHEEEHIGVRAPAEARSQKLQPHMDDAPQAQGSDGHERLYV